MGSDAEVFVFDHNAYMTEVVPALMELLLAGRAADWLNPLLKKREIRPELWKKTDIARFCKYLERDFSWRGPYDLAYTYDLKWDQRSCKSEDCPERERCPFHQSSSPAFAEEVNWLFQVAVGTQCLGRSQFVGRSATVSHYSELLPSLGVGPDDSIVSLLARLGKRGFVIGYQWGFGYEGINGWLDPNETVDLAKRLDVLQLPRYGASLEAMQQFLRAESGTYECPGFSFEALSLSFVRTVSTIAARESRGLLWGNGVMPSRS